MAFNCLLLQIQKLCRISSRSLAEKLVITGKLSRKKGVWWTDHRDMTIEDVEIGAKRQTNKQHIETMVCHIKYRSASAE